MPHLSHDLFLAYPLSKRSPLSSPLYSKAKCWLNAPYSPPSFPSPLGVILSSSVLFRCCIHVPIEKRQTSFLKTLNYFNVLCPSRQIRVFIMDKNSFSNPQFILKCHPRTSLVVHLKDSALQCRGHGFDPWELRFHMWCGVTPQKSSSIILFFRGFPGGSVVKNPSANVGDAGLFPRSGRVPGGGNGRPTPVFLPEKIPWMEEPDRLWSVRSERVEDD